jgi:uncharacterized protein YbjT (DUF2867 family)
MNVGQDLIVITGATGQQGGAIARELLARGHKVRAVTRKPDGPAAQELKRLGAEVVTGDLDDPASIERALAGAWGAFAVQNTWEAGVEREEEQGLRFAEIAKAKGVQHLVYSSVASAHRNTGIPHFENKWRIEQRVRALGFPSCVILRPVFFMQNFQGPFFLPYLQQGTLAIGIQPTTRLQMIDVADIGKYGLQAFERHAELNGRAIDIAGDEPTGPEAAEIFSRVTGRPIQFFSVPIGEIRKASEDYALMLEWFDAVGYDVDIAKTSKEFGIRPTPLAEFVGRVEWAPAAVTV